MDVEPPLLDWLDDLATAVTSTPIDLADQVPMLRVRRIAGGGDWNNDRPTVSVQAFATPTSGSPRAHFDLATQVEDRFMSIAVNGPELVGGASKVVIEDPVKESGPVELPYPNPAVRVTETIFRFTARR